jgi:cellulose biosynthesis protein BcsQ
MIVSFVQTKGGTGKSTLALNTAFSHQIHSKFRSIALVELDPQGSLKNWWTQREEEGLDSGQVSFHHISSTQKEVFQNSIKTIAAHNELIIMDIPGESTGKLHTRFACASSDLVIIPMRTSTNDELAFADNLYPIIREITNIAPKKRKTFYVLPSFIHPQSNTGNVIGYFTDILPSHVECMEVVYPHRSVYENFNRDGMNLKEYALSVEQNKRFACQASRAVADIEEISKNITFLLETNNGGPKKKKKTR